MYSASGLNLIFLLVAILTFTIVLILKMQEWNVVEKEVSFISNYGASRLLFVCLLVHLFVCLFIFDVFIYFFNTFFCR